MQDRHAAAPEEHLCCCCLQLPALELLDSPAFAVAADELLAEHCAEHA